MSYKRPLVEVYSKSCFAHIERRKDVFNQECVVFNSLTGKSHSTHATMEGAKYSLDKLDLKLRLANELVDTVNKSSFRPKTKADWSEGSYHDTMRKAADAKRKKYGTTATYNGY